MTDQPTDAPLLATPLHALHCELGARMVPFAGYDMPVQYPAGILTEHRHTRSAAGLFDVSHMGQVRLTGAPVPALAAALETLVPGDIQGLVPGAMRYTQFTSESGGILDDLMVTRFEDHLFLVVNAACKDADIAHLRAGLGGDLVVEPLPDRALLALQGPQAVAVLMRLGEPEAGSMAFMSARPMRVAGCDCLVSRSGYTGEDGFELSVAAGEADRLARALLAEPEVGAVGLGARDSLRLEAGLCLYGHDIDTETSPIEAALTWSIGKRRREQGGFPGAARIQRELAEGPARRRVGIGQTGGPPAREGAELALPDGTVIGRITSGGFGPTVNGPVAMGYVATPHAAAGTPLSVIVRGRAHPAATVRLPFVKPGYYRG